MTIKIFEGDSATLQKIVKVVALLLVVPQVKIFLRLLAIPEKS